HGPQERVAQYHRQRRRQALCDARQGRPGETLGNRLWQATPRMGTENACDRIYVPARQSPADGQCECIDVCVGFAVTNARLEAHSSPYRISRCPKDRTNLSSGGTAMLFRPGMLPVLPIGLLVVLPVLVIMAMSSPARADDYKPHHEVNPKNPQV